jgi:hypothetical protein
MPVVAGEPTHEAVVQVHDGGLIAKGQKVRYEGAPDWKFRPLDRQAAAEWDREIADPQRALRANLQTHDVLHPPMSAAELERERELRRSRGLPIRIA